MNICDIEIVEDIERLRNGKIVLYGTGDWGKRVNKELKSLNMNVSHVVKTIAWKGETFEDDVEVEQISAIASQINNSQYVIIIASQIYGEEMMAHLDSLGICAKDGAKILTLRAFNTAVLVNTKRTVATPPEDYMRGIKGKNCFIQRSAPGTSAIWCRCSSFSTNGVLLCRLHSTQDRIGLRMWKRAVG